MTHQADVFGVAGGGQIETHESVWRCLQTGFPPGQVEQAGGAGTPRA